MVVIIIMVVVIAIVYSILCRRGSLSAALGSEAGALVGQGRPLLLVTVAADRAVDRGGRHILCHATSLAEEIRGGSIQEATPAPRNERTNVPSPPTPLGSNETCVKAW